MTRGRTYAIATALLATGALALVGCGDDSEPGLKVGACTTADPTEALSLDVKAVDCEDKAAKSRIVREVPKSADCDVASVSDSSKDKVYCTEPYPPGSAPSKPQVGACTTAGTNQSVTVNIRLVNCADKEARSRIVKNASRESECEKGSVKDASGQVFCIEPVK
jgi:hypothetical protein